MSNGVFDTESIKGVDLRRNGIAPIAAWMQAPPGFESGCAQHRALGRQLLSAATSPSGSTTVISRMVPQSNHAADPPKWIQTPAAALVPNVSPSSTIDSQGPHRLSTITVWAGDNIAGARQWRLDAAGP